MKEMSRLSQTAANKSYVDISQRESGSSTFECYFCIPRNDLNKWGKTCKWMRNHGKRKMGNFWPGPCCK